MVKGWGVVATCAVALACGCALVAGLGDEAHLAEASDGGDGATGSLVPNPGRCGLPGAPNPQCEDCLNARCCQESLACSRSARCVQGLLGCLKPCAFVDSCSVACLQAYSDTPELALLTQCTSSECTSTCIPNDECRRLGKCCVLLPDSGPEVNITNVCVGRVFEDNAAACSSYLAERQEAGACP